MIFWICFVAFLIIKSRNKSYKILYGNPNVHFLPSPIIFIFQPSFIFWLYFSTSSLICGSSANPSLKASNFYDLPIRSGFDSIKLNLFLETIFSFFIRCSFILWIICFCCFLYVFYIGNFDELLLELEYIKPYIKKRYPFDFYRSQNTWTILLQIGHNRSGAYHRSIRLSAWHFYT